MRPRSPRVMWHYGLVPLIISLHPANFGGHSRCEREESLLFVCNMTLRDFVVRESCDTMGEFPSWLVTTLQSLVVIDLLDEEILSFQFVTGLHKTTWSEGHVILWGVILIISHCPVKFGGHRFYGIADINLLICHVTSRDHMVRGSFDIMDEFSSS